MLSKDALPALGSSDDAETLFSVLRKSNIVDKRKLERPHMASEEKAADAERHIQELEHNRDDLK